MVPGNIFVYNVTSKFYLNELWSGRTHGEHGQGEDGGVSQGDDGGVSRFFLQFGVEWAQ